jgi:hypothetical protein
MPKSYSQYKYADVAVLGLDIQLNPILRNISLLAPSELLEKILDINFQQTLSTEKAKSEFIIAPILYEIARKNQDIVSFFSGHNLDVDKALGLKGFCDFLYSKAPKTPIIKAPIFCIVEAKNDNLERGIPQCIAEMYAARLSNERNKKPINVIYGCVTTGYQWLFLKLDEAVVYQDTTIYSFNELPKILGILQFIVEN